MILGQPLINVFKSSIVMILLLLCSIIALALIIERFLYFLRNSFDTRRGFLLFSQVLRNQGMSAALAYVNQRKNPLNGLFAVALQNQHLDPDNLYDVLSSYVIEEKLKFDRYLGGMGTLANAATLLGLLGTVTGLIRAFHNIAITGSGGPAVISAGIAEALLTTAFGLFIGIPTLFFYNYYTKKSNELALSLEGVCDKLIVLLDTVKKRSTTTNPEPVSTPKPPPPPPEDVTWKF
jgi:biopolymer transport protein ExbB|uniref:MotA/TolQ/ExbB proton channel family protein n=1 Tax=candidate division WOR-3 bacterium TaxID=2052148 RepID=A0A7V3RIC6_UNCW3